MAIHDRFAEVILPLAVEGTFTYSIPEGLAGRLIPGDRVLVSFGKRKLYCAVVFSIGPTPPEGLKPKPILEILDDHPLVLAQQLRFWEWIASYYLCTLGEVARAALPSGLRPESESRVRAHPGYPDDGSMDPNERLMYEVVREQGEVTMKSLVEAELPGNPVKILRALVDRGAVDLNEFITRTTPRKSVPYVRLSEEFATDKSLNGLLDDLEKAPRQREVIEKYLDLAGSGSSGLEPRVSKKGLTVSGASPGAISSLLAKGILVRENREEMERAVPGNKKIQDDQHDPSGPVSLTAEQERVLMETREQFGVHQSVLLHGVTSSGKTEIYFHLIKDTLDQGKQVLYLLPEISITAQMILRLKRVFGTSVGIFHSGYSDSDRVHIYRNLLGLTDEEPFRIILGVRSALFLPFRELGLVVIDEEHETTFKQNDPAPRYHARDSAQILALYHGARVLMGTATPSFETLYNARGGKFGLVRLDSRFGSTDFPEFVLSDVRKAMHRKQMVSHFTPELLKEIKNTVTNGEQVILFQNRRGYSPFILCDECGHVPKCSRCDISLTYHRASGKLECHYCGKRVPMPHACPSCASTRMTMKGFGTEKLEDEVRLVVEGIRVGRLDTDSARTTGALERVLLKFEKGELDMLIGTQMISKGLDFGNVSLVGVVDADSMLHFPDFRAFERCYQLISQVGGRAGRRSERGKVIIQTMDPDHPVIQNIISQDYEGLFTGQMEERETFGYPPFRRVIRILFRHRVPSILDGAADLVGKELKEIFSTRVYGPQYPPVRRIQGLFLKQVLLKIEREASYEKAKELLKRVLEDVLDSEVFRAVRVSIDVDPY